MVLQVVSGGADEPCELGQRCSTTRALAGTGVFDLAGKSRARSRPAVSPMGEGRQEREAM